MRKEVTSIAYVGIYPPSAPRDRIYVEELRRHGVKITEHVSNTPGFPKYANLFKQVRRAAQEADIVWVGYLSVVAVPVAYLATRKKIVYNALGSAYEAYILDRRVAGQFSPKGLLFWFADFLAFHLADVTLVESQAQKEYLARQFLVPHKKLQVVFTGVDESVFHPDSTVKKSEIFTVAFRGMFSPATGVDVVLEAARLLKDKPVHFWISGWGQLLPYVKDFIKKNDLKNVELNTVFLEPDELRRKLLSAHVLLGQFSNNARLDRTIQHKTSEALALGMPYITRDSDSNRELLSDGNTCILVKPNDPKEIYERVVSLSSRPTELFRLSHGAREKYLTTLHPEVLGRRVLQVITSLNK